MRYTFKCHECSNEIIYEASIQDGPPDILLCPECAGDMYNQLSTNVIFKGDGWCDKDLRAQKNGENFASIDKFEKQMDEHKQTKELQNEVLKERRRGRQSFAEYKKHNRSKVEKYRNNLRKGIRGE